MWGAGVFRLLFCAVGGVRVWVWVLICGFFLQLSAYNADKREENLEGYR